MSEESICVCGHDKFDHELRLPLDSFGEDKDYGECPYKTCKCVLFELDTRDEKATIHPALELKSNKRSGSPETFKSIIEELEKKRRDHVCSDCIKHYEIQESIWKKAQKLVEDCIKNNYYCNNCEFKCQASDCECVCHNGWIKVEELKKELGIGGENE